MVHGWRIARRSLWTTIDGDLTAAGCISCLRLRDAQFATAEGTAYILVYRTPRAQDEVLPRPLPATPQAAGDWIIDFRKMPAGWRITQYTARTVLEPQK